jgi:hypothetical protein
MDYGTIIDLIGVLVVLLLLWAIITVVLNMTWGSFFLYAAIGLAGFIIGRQTAH